MKKIVEHNLLTLLQEIILKASIAPKKVTLPRLTLFYAPPKASSCPPTWSRQLSRPWWSSTRLSSLCVTTTCMCLSSTSEQRVLPYRSGNQQRASCPLYLGEGGIKQYKILQKKPTEKPLLWLFSIIILTTRDVSEKICTAGPCIWGEVLRL